ncbi:Acetolactate synthase isozyme 2 large subunit [compost metagenome]
MKLAEAYGVKGIRATTKEEARTAWEEALNTPGPVLVEFLVSKDENVYPMVTQGSTIDQMLMGDEE